MYIMETVCVYYIKMNIGGLEQNSSMIILHVIDQILHLSSVGLIFFFLIKQYGGKLI